MSDITPSGSVNSRQYMRLKYPLRNIGERVYRTSRAYIVARNAELLRESLMRPRTLSQQVQRTLFTVPAKTQSSCLQEIRPKDKQPQANAVAPETGTKKDTIEGTHERGEVNGGREINKGKYAVGPGDGGGGGGGGGEVTSVYGENFKKRYGGGRVQKQ